MGSAILAFISVASSVLKHATHRTMDSSLVKRRVNDQQYFCIKQALIFIFFVYSLSIYCSISKSIFLVAADSSVHWIYYSMQGICSSGFKIKEMNKRKKNRNCGWRPTLNHFKCSINNSTKGKIKMDMLSFWQECLSKVKQ